MKSLQLDAVGMLTARDVPLPFVGPEDVLIRVEAAGICGTDRHLFKGEFPSKPPVTLGHEFGGIVERVGERVVAARVGARVTGDPNVHCGRCAHCHAGRVNLCDDLSAIGVHRDGGFAQYVVAPQTNVHLLPDALDPMHGAFCEPLACCLHGLDMADIRPGSRVAVIGGGVIGLLVVQLARLAGARAVVLSTRNAEKRRLGERLGASATVDGGAGMIAQVAGPGGLIPGGADVVVECAGVAETVAQAPSLARKGGVVVVLGVMAKGAKVSLEPFDLVFREIRLLGSFVNPFTHARAAALVASGALEIDPLITRRVPLCEAARFIADAPAPSDVKTLIVPG